MNILLAPALEEDICNISAVTESATNCDVPMVPLTTKSPSIKAVAALQELDPRTYAFESVPPVFRTIATSNCTGFLPATALNSAFVGALVSAAVIRKNPAVEVLISSPSLFAQLLQELTNYHPEEITH